MDSSLVQLFSLITDNIFLIIYIFAAAEIFLVVNVFLMMKKHEDVLVDVSDNLVKGFKDAPDKDSTQNIHERIQGVLDYITDKMRTEPGLKSEFGKNASNISRRPLYARHYKIEIYASVMSTLVQVFPLLGILGTILAIAQTAFQGGGQINAEALSKAFVLAMDTTILGITFSILFMVIESTFQPKIERVINESSEFKKIVSSIKLS